MQLRQFCRKLLTQKTKLFQQNKTAKKITFLVLKFELHFIFISRSGTKTGEIEKCFDEKIQIRLQEK